MDAFNPIPPDWVEKATHASGFCCPRCSQLPSKAKAVWINRRSPVYIENYQRKWQEFYHCECEAAWWAWSNDRPPSEFSDRKIHNNYDDDLS
ncbi:hypothetical protein [Pseudanabaena mucicola]|uniref:Uncharacterized protein n=1 Tax=Pseudanabaena mucicola FACHB-723 TaxID=2692860 RepID=A0ABR7ZSU0_9CYAN|nr:hypothetical protein [Pseudanabaena mucicola]MBD2186996.1 hypothetical protein [Pseudanabaena mucicola FACHB-723]